MNQHVSHLLAAYHDGELQGRQLRQVEAHLEVCEACRVELHNLQTLSFLLQEFPPAADLTSPDRFVAQVQLRLPKRSELTIRQRMLNTAWWLAPVGLVGAWIFIQTTVIVTGVVLVALNLAGFPVAEWLPAAPGGLGLGNLFSLEWMENGRRFGLGWPLAGILPLAIGLLYLSWLATWWARSQHEGQES